MFDFRFSSGYTFPYANMSPTAVSYEPVYLWNVSVRYVASTRQSSCLSVAVIFKYVAAIKFLFYLKSVFLHGNQTFQILAFI